MNGIYILKSAYVLAVRRELGGKLQCLFNICSVYFTGNGVLVPTQDGKKRANTSALDLLVDGKVAKELQFC